MNEMLIDCLEVVSKELAQEVAIKKKWGNFGNSYGNSESRKFLIAASDILKAIAESL